MGHCRGHEQGEQMRWLADTTGRIAEIFSKEHREDNWK